MNFNIEVSCTSYCTNIYVKNVYGYFNTFLCLAYKKTTYGILNRKMIYHCLFIL